MSRISRMKRTPKTARSRVLGNVMTSRNVSTVQRRTVGASNLPIRNYANLRVAEIERKLVRLSGADLRRIKDFETEHKSRKTLLRTINQKLKAA